MIKANKNSWQNFSMPEKYEKIDFSYEFTQQEYEQICYGFLPKCMEDKWFIYVENDKIYFHRSWTGYCIFIIEFIFKDENYEIINVICNRNKEQHIGNKESDIHILNQLLNAFVKQSNFNTSIEVTDKYKDGYFK